VLEFGGVNSSEHGDGLARSEFNRRVFGDALYGAMQETKQLFDPGNRMNPGKIVNAPAMTDHLRDVALPAGLPFPTRLRFDAPGGMRGAADRCMNIAPRWATSGCTTSLTCALSARPARASARSGSTWPR
jgi:hypothetical protein